MELESESLEILDGDVVSGASSVDMNACGESGMKAAIFLDDAIRAGGFGARDDIGCFLPVASDFTDFEASLRDLFVTLKITKILKKKLQDQVLAGQKLKSKSNCLLRFGTTYKPSWL